MLPSFVILFLSTCSVVAATPAATNHCDTMLQKMPELMLLNAPFTPFQRNALRTLNATHDNIEKLAQQASVHGVTTIFVPGSMGQFETMTMNERKILMSQWVEYGHKYGLYVILHVGTSVQQDAITLAQYAQSIGADAIGSVPMYYESSSDVSTIINFLTPIAAAAPNIPLFYYHLPGVTNAKSMADWFKIVNTYNTTKALLFAPEPKLASFSLGRGRGVVLAEDFYAPTYVRMLNHYFKGTQLR
jgi:N-acetylneuraminate lyase